MERGENLEVKVKLSTQTFVESGGPEVYPTLELAGVVLAKLDARENSGREWNRKRVNKQLDVQAKDLGATHVFAVKYMFRKSERDGEHLYGATGTAYKPVY